MASYRFKDAASAAKVRSAQPETGRRAQYSRDTDKTYRNTSGEKTRAGAALREQKRLMAEPTEKSKDRIERFFCGNRERTRNRSCSGSRAFGDETR